MGLWTMNADGSDVKPLLANPMQPHFDGHWSPDSKRIAFVWDILQGTDGKLQIDVVNADGSEQKNVIPHKAFEESPRWSPDGKQLLWVSARDKKQNLHIADADGQNIRKLTGEFKDNNPTWSPDGKQIAFCSARTGNLEIHVMLADGSNVRRLTDHPSIDMWPVWSPDGKRIAFTSNRDGNYEIYVMDPEGKGLRNISQSSASENHATWSPDSKQIAFISNRRGMYGVYVVDAK